MSDLRGSLRALETRYAAAGRLFLLHLDLTWRCPLDCAHCYLDGARSDEMDTSAILRLLDEARDEGVAQVVLSGGEPMLRPDFGAILQAARDRGFAVVVKTTGLRLDAAAADRFAALGWVLVDVSLHAVDPAIHDGLVGRPGSFAKAAAAIEFLRARDVPVRVARSVVQGVGDDGGALRRWAAERGCRVIESTAVIRRRDGSPPGRDVLPREDQVGMVVRVFHDRPAPRPRPLERSAAPCAAGRTRLYVTPAGEVTPCVAWPRVLGRIDRGGLRAVLDSPQRARVLAFSNADRPACLACDLRTTCDFCPGQAEVLAGDPGAPYPEACERARMFAEALRRLDPHREDAP